ncbi:MAG TPA: NAD(P)-binding protein [candidate division Zixibacteria bacterium]|nr:NAD(P)-binding protein [candidate division Zixibacteria bacterium]
MGLIGKKKKKLVTRGGGVSSREQSPLRPSGVPKPAPCGMEGCPNHNHIRHMLMTISKAQQLETPMDEALEKAWKIFAETTPFHSVCGRVCPHPCESACNRNGKEGGVGINAIERFIGDYALEKKFTPPMLTDQKRSEKIAVIGSGPAGISCAYQLARRGYQVTIFEAFPKTGGMLRYGIPDYRLPQSILDAEIQRVLDMGVDLKTNTIVGKDVTVDALKNEFNAVFIGIGAHTGLNLRVDGEDAPNVMTGVDLLHKVNSGEAVEIGDNVVVVGGGDTAIDAARISRRLGAKATILYRRTREEMPAIEEEIEGALAEGVEIHYLAAPIEIYNDGSRATGMKCQKMQLGEPDASGRRRPVPIEGDTFDLEFTTLVTAISQAPDFTGFEDFVEGKDWIKVDEKFKTKIEKAFSGGDNTNLGLVIDAIHHGRRAAEAIHESISGEAMPDEKKGPAVKLDKMHHEYYEAKERHEPKNMDPNEALKSLTAEITYTFDLETAVAEAGRCMSCGLCFDCGTCWSLCQDSAIKKPSQKGGPVIGAEEYYFKHDVCTGCKKCSEQCPCGYIEMH